MNEFTKFTIKRRTSEDTWDVRKLVEDVKLTEDMHYTAGELDFSLLEVNDRFGIRNGDVVSVDWNGHHIFYGYVFSWELDKGTQYKVVAYDSLRYFKSSDSMVFPVSTLGQRFNTICDSLNLPHKMQIKPTHKLKSELCDDKTYFAMLQSFIKKQRTATGHHYFIADSYGTVELRRYPYKKLPLIIGDHSQVTDYSFKRSIDSTANVIRLVKTTSTKGHKSTTSVTSKGGSIKRWGKLVYTKEVTSKTNSGQMKQQAQNLLHQKNKQMNELKISCYGNVNLRPGNSVIVSIKDLRDVGIGTKEYLIEKATHNFKSDYSVDLELRV